MKKSINYKDNTDIKNAWIDVLKSLRQLSKDPMGFLISAHKLFIAIHAYHYFLDKELGGDEFGQCFEQLSSNMTVMLLPKDADRLNKIILSCESYPSYTAREKNKRHHRILNVPLRKHIRTNELQSWFLSLSRYIHLIALKIKVKIGSEVKQFVCNEDTIQPNHLFSSLLIDCSEDYFIDTVLDFIHLLSEFVSLNEVVVSELKIIKEMINKSKELLYDRQKPLPLKYQELAFLCASHSPLSEGLLSIFSLFLSKIPPGINGFHEVPVNQRQKFINNNLNRTKSFFLRYQYFIPSEIITHASKQQITSIEDKINQLPYLPIAIEGFSNFSEDKLLEKVFCFINSLCQYVIRQPEANIIHDRHHVVYLLLKKSQAAIFDRETAPILRYRELVAYAIKHDVVEKGAIHQLIKSLAEDEAALSEYSRLNIPVSQRRNFIEYKTTIHNCYYDANYYHPSALSNQEIKEQLTRIPIMVIEHLKKCCRVDLTPLWKIVNWFLSVFNHSHPLIKSVANYKLDYQQDLAENKLDTALSLSKN